ncbi:MAG: hypothetical protein HC913_05030 [Microscillaceae bacterium]|nr:hypothetical protein [Microscillaceae bacterium]
MKRLFLLCICATLSGCSWTHYFLLRNDTQETLEIAYQLNLSLEEYNMFDKHIKVFHKKVKDSDYYNLEGEDVKHYLT